MALNARSASLRTCRTFSRSRVLSLRRSSWRTTAGVVPVLWKVEGQDVRSASVRASGQDRRLVARIARLEAARLGKPRAGCNDQRHLQIVARVDEAIYERAGAPPCIGSQVHRSLRSPFFDLVQSFDHVIVQVRIVQKTPTADTPSSAASSSPRSHCCASRSP